MKFSYAITAKKTRKPITKTHYLDYLDYLTDHGKVGNVNFETTKGLHTHFVLKCDEQLDYNKLKPTKHGWNVFAVPLYNRKGWIRYIRKDNEDNKELNRDVKELYEEDEYIEDIEPFKMPTKRLF